MSMLLSLCCNDYTTFTLLLLLYYFHFVATIILLSLFTLIILLSLFTNYSTYLLLLFFIYFLPSSSLCTYYFYFLLPRVLLISIDILFSSLLETKNCNMKIGGFFLPAHYFFECTYSVYTRCCIYYIVISLLIGFAIILPTTKTLHNNMAAI